MKLFGSENVASATLDEMLDVEHGPSNTDGEPSVQHINVIKRQEALRHLDGLRDEYIFNQHNDPFSELAETSGQAYNDFHMRMIRRELEYLPRDTQQQRDEAVQATFALSYNEDIHFTQRTTELANEQKPQPKSLFHKLGLIAVRAQNAIASKVASRVQTTHNEDDKQRKGYGKVAAYGAVVAVGAAVAYYSLNKVGMDGFPGIGGNGIGSNPSSPHQPNHSSGSWYDQWKDNLTDNQDSDHKADGGGRHVIDKTENGSHVHHGAQDAAKFIHLQDGGNPWQVAQHQLGPNASIEDIDCLKDRILEINDITEHQAYSLPVGYSLRMPAELIEELQKKYK